MNPSLESDTVRQGRYDDLPLLYVIYFSSTIGGGRSAAAAGVGLQSFLNAYRPVRSESRVIFLNDGLVSSERMELLRQWGEVASLGGIGEIAAYRLGLRIALALPADAVVCFLHDGLLLEENVFEEMFDAFAATPEIDYLMVPERRSAFRRRFGNKPASDGIIGRRTAFAVRLDRLQRDYAMHVVGTWSSGFLNRLAWKWIRSRHAVAVADRGFQTVDDDRNEEGDRRRSGGSSTWSRFARMTVRPL